MASSAALLMSCRTPSSLATRLRGTGALAHAPRRANTYRSEKEDSAWSALSYNYCYECIQWETLVSIIFGQTDIVWLDLNLMILMLSIVCTRPIGRGGGVHSFRLKFINNSMQQ